MNSPPMSDRNGHGTSGNLRYGEGGQLGKMRIPQHGSLEAERRGCQSPEIGKLLHSLYSRLNSAPANDLARFVDVLKLHGFLPFHDAR